MGAAVGYDGDGRQVRTGYLATAVAILILAALWTI